MALGIGHGVALQAGLGVDDRDRGVRNDGSCRIRNGPVYGSGLCKQTGSQQALRSPGSQVEFACVSPFSAC